MTITGAGLAGPQAASAPTPAAPAAPIAPALAAGANPGAAALAPIRERVEAMARLGVWRMEPRTSRVAWSAEMFRILGMDPAAVPGPDAGSLDGAIHRADRGRFDNAMAAAIGGARGSVECRIVRPDGTSAWVRVAAELEPGRTGETVALVGFVQELTLVDEAAALAIAAGTGSMPDRHHGAGPSRPAMTRKAAAPRVRAGVVLLVEDEDTVRTVLGRMLGSLGFSVLEASSGDEALELIGYDQEDGIDLVVTDIRMPGVSGPELARRIRAVRDVPVLFVSGYAADLEDEVRNARRTHILEKPFDAESLGAAIRAVLATGD